jgi:hypothetical protein
MLGACSGQGKTMALCLSESSCLKTTLTVSSAVRAWACHYLHLWALTMAVSGSMDESDSDSGSGSYSGSGSGSYSGSGSGSDDDEDVVEVTPVQGSAMGDVRVKSGAPRSEQPKPAGVSQTQPETTISQTQKSTQKKPEINPEYTPETTPKKVGRKSAKLKVSDPRVKTGTEILPDVVIHDTEKEAEPRLSPMNERLS